MILILLVVFELFFQSEDREDSEEPALIIGQLTESSSEQAGYPVWGPLQTCLGPLLPLPCMVSVGCHLAALFTS